MTGRAEAWLARRGGPVEALRLPGALFGAVGGLRRALYDRGLLPVARLDVPVVCVGNLTAGGTGKTPMVRWVAERLQRGGRRVGLLSRGYRAQSGESGDEARMLARGLDGVPHVECADRVAGGQELVERGVDVVVLDDGFQHRRLHRDLDIVLVDATRPWGLPRPPAGGEPVEALLPRGLLREPPHALRRAHAVVLTRTDQCAPADLERLEERLLESAPGLARARARHAPAALLAPDGRRLEPESLAGRRVRLVSGIGNPESFEATVRALGAEVSEHRKFPDHHVYQSEDLRGWGTRPRAADSGGAGGATGAGGDEWIVTTEKDAVKLERGHPPVHVLEVRLEIAEGEPALEALLDALPRGRAERLRGSLHEGLHG